MKVVYGLIFFVILFFACTSNNSDKKSSNADSLKVNRPAMPAAKPIYITRKQDFDLDTAKTDTIFLLDSTKVNLTMCISYTGDYVVPDTTCDHDTCLIRLFKNHCAHISIKSSTEKEVFVTKDFFQKSIKEINLSRYLIGTTTIDSIAHGARQIILSTFLGLPQSDLGFYFIYSVSLNGNLKFIKTLRDTEDEED